VEDTLWCSEFYGTDWIERNGYGLRSPLNIFVFPEKDSPDGDYSASRHTFGFNIKRLSRLMRQRSKGELLILSHTHPGIADLSEGDQRPYSFNMIIGFDTVSEELKQLAHLSFGVPKIEAVTERPVYRGQMPAREWKGYTKNFERGELRRIGYNSISPEEYASIVAECHPTVRLFHTDGEGNVNRIPLHINGRELL